MKVKPQSIHIYSDGEKITTAIIKQDGKVIKKAEARLDNIDTFDFNVGAALAFARLFGREPVLEVKNQEVKEEEFKPYLKRDGYNYGNIGDKATFKDAVGRDLYVGDTIFMYYDGKQSSGESFIGFEDGKFRIMGIWVLDFTQEQKEWKILKNRSYQDIKDGERVWNTEYIKTKR